MKQVMRNFKISIIRLIWIFTILFASCKIASHSGKAPAPTKVVYRQFNPGAVWVDNNGIPINAHGGGVIYYKGVYYWYGEHKLPGKSEAEMADGGIHCYSSKDLMNWKDEGLVLSVINDGKQKDLAYGSILERPKVIYNEDKHIFYVFFKYYPKDTGYLKGYLGMATSQKPTGPFTYQHKFLGADSEYGSGDFSMFKDTDGQVYHSTVRKPDKTFVIGQLQNNFEYAQPGSYIVANGIDLHTEAPAIVIEDEKYYLFGSGSSGWEPNEARAFVADSIKGKYHGLGNPLIGVNPQNGLGPEKTFGGQISYIIPVQGKSHAYIAMFDIWNPNAPINGRYVWLPLIFKNGKPEIKWLNTWDLSFFN